MVTKKTLPDRQDDEDRNLPVWLRIPFYAATYGSAHFRDWRFSLRRKFLTKVKKEGRESARQWARSEAWRYWKLTAERGTWWGFRALLRIIFGGAS